MYNGPMFTSSTSSPISVSALNRQVRECLESRFPLSWVSGEISNLTYAASGHVYFSLKDAQAQVRCVMWRSRAQLLGWRLENGQKIEAMDYLDRTPDDSWRHDVPSISERSFHYDTQQAFTENIERLK